MGVSAYQPSRAALDAQAAPVDPKTQHQRLMKQTRNWVGLSFFAPMLKQIRQSPFHSTLFDGGRGGEAFGSMYDEQIAERMTGSSGNKLVNGIVRRIEAKMAYAKQGKLNMKLGNMKSGDMNFDNSKFASPAFDGEGADRNPGPPPATPGDSNPAPESINTPGSAHVATTV
jgi:Rod binding domain-containing protein